MSVTEEDRAYYEAAEAAFIRRRGTPFLLSPKDFALLREWRALGVPIAAVEAGIDDAFTRREERSAVGRVNSLSYCRDAVLEAWERLSDAARGKGEAASGADVDVPASIDALSERLRESASRRPELAGPLEAARASLARLRGSRKTAEEIENSLARLDRRLAKDLHAALPDAERAAVDAEISRQLGAALSRMDADAADKTTKTLVRRAVRERLDLPRLTLL
jgi:hypothetical protein